MQKFRVRAWGVSNIGVYGCFNAASVQLAHVGAACLVHGMAGDCSVSSTRASLSRTEYAAESRRQRSEPVLWQGAAVAVSNTGNRYGTPAYFWPMFHCVLLLFLFRLTRLFFIIFA